MVPVGVGVGVGVGVVVVVGIASAVEEYRRTELMPEEEIRKRFYDRDGSPISAVELDRVPLSADGECGCCDGTGRVKRYFFFGRGEDGIDRGTASHKDVRRRSICPCVEVRLQ